MTRANRYEGSTLDDFLKEEGIYEEVKATTAKRLIAMQLEKALKQRKLSKNKLAAAMGTSRASLDRLLDPANPSVTLLTLAKAANVLGKRINISFVDA